MAIANIPNIQPDTTTIIIGTFGDESWKTLAETRAIPSARAQGCPVIHAHADTLHHARNTALGQVTTPWVIHLDADDEVEPGYIQAMAIPGHGDVRVPMVRYMERGRAIARPRFPQVAGHQHACTADCLPYGNWIVVGAAARTDLINQIGGWRGFEWSEDWDVWLRCHLAGATFTRANRAIYRAHVRRDSRNRGGTHDSHLESHRAIARANGVPIP